MAWIYLAAAAAFEVTFALGMKYSQGFSKLTPSIVTAVAVVGGIGFLTLALKELPVSIAYPIWTAVGTLGTVVLGFALLGEALTVAKVLSALAIVGGVAGLKIASS
jgi:quaternary ammonium compound-resistance protein SugE